MSEPTVAELAERIRADGDAAIHPVVRVVDERGGFEVATGYRGIGVFVTVLSAHGRRRLVTHGLTEKEAMRLGKAIIQAAEASLIHRERANR